MKDLIIYGSGGMAREVVALVEDINEVEPTWDIKGYINDFTGNGSDENINGYRILGDRYVLRNIEKPAHVVIAISDPKAKRTIFDSIRQYGVRFPTLIHPSAKIARNACIGEGSVISIGCIVSTNVTLGDHVFLNMRTVVGHDASIGDFSSCLVNSVVAGNVTIAEEVLLGSGSLVMEKKVIGKGAKVSLGSVVSFDVEEGHVVMSRPSKSMYFGE